MLKSLFAGLLLMVTATPALAQESATDVVARFQVLVGKPVGGTDITVVSVVAEGSVVVIVLDTPKWSTSRGVAANSFLNGFCAAAGKSNFFANKQLRIDTLENGKGMVTGVLFNKCPPPEAKE